MWTPCDYLVVCVVMLAAADGRKWQYITIIYEKKLKDCLASEYTCNTPRLSPVFSAANLAASACACLS